MKTKRKDLNEIVRRIESPYHNIGEQIKRDKKIEELFKNTNNIDKYDLNKMIPKVSYDDWVICLYEIDNKFYFIDEDCIVEVIPTMIITLDEKYKTYFTENGKAVYNIEDLDCVLNLNMQYFACGESDDMKRYIVFDTVQVL